MPTKSGVKAIPDGYHTVTPYLVVEGAARLIEFLKQGFGAVEKSRMSGPEGKVMHAEVRVGDSHIMLADVGGRWPATTSAINLYVTDTDAVYARALAAGASSLRAPEDQFYGDRSGGVKDAWGNVWWISTHVEDVSPEEMEKRRRQMAGS